MPRAPSDKSGKARRVLQGELIEKLVRNIVDATSRAVGRDFLHEVAIALCRELGVDRVYISRLSDDGETVDSLVAVVGGRRAANVRYDIAGGPCETVTRESSLCLYPRGVAAAFPDDRFLADEGIEGYIGVPLYGAGERCLGLMVAMSRDPLILGDLHKLVFEFLAGRVAAELNRALTDDELRQRDALLSAIVDNLPHGLTVKDPDGRYMLVNREFTRRYGLSGEDILGKSFEARFPQWEQDGAVSRTQEQDVVARGTIITREQDRRFADGTAHRLEVVKFPITDGDGGLIGVGSLGVDITERTRWEREARERERMLKGYHEALDRIVAADAMASADSREAYALLTRIAAETLNCERVSVWTARPDRGDIRCVDLYQLSKAAHAAGMALARDAFPAYFEAFRNAEIIDAADAVNDPRTRELADGYLAEHGITSVLDAAIHVGGELRGIFCLEHVGPARQWPLEEQSLARSLAALTSLIMARQEQQEAERGRQSVERRFSEIVNALPSALSLKDRNQRYVFINKIYERNYGIRAEEAHGRTIRELGLNNPEILAVIAAEDTAVLEQGRSFTGETIRIGRDGIERTALVSKFPVYDKDGNVDLVATLWTDISEQKAVQRTLEDAQARLRAITDNVPIMLSLKDRDGVYRHCNAKFAEWHGIRPEQVIGKTSRDLLPDARAEEIGKIDREVLRTGEARVFETDTVFPHQKDGAPLILRQFKFPIRDNAGAVTGIGTAMLDITDERRAEQALQAHLAKLEEMVADRTVELTDEIAERRRAEAELLRTEANLRAILEKSPVGVAVVGREPRRRLFVNQSFLDMFGAKDEGALNAVPMADTYVDAADLERLGGEFGETGAILAREVRRKRMDGTEWWALLDARSVEFEGERAAIVWHYDITDRKEAAAALARQAETLEQAVAARTRELRESESLLNSIFEHLPVGIFIKDHCCPVN